jgi:serine/threonine protein kinase
MTKKRTVVKEIKGYSIIGKIAKGGMGEVYKARHKALNKEVILKKLISKAPASFYERFKREASIMMEMSHPNIVHIFDYFKEGSSSYIAMEYIDGYNLAEIIKRLGQVPVYLAVYIIYTVAKGLKYAHSKEIIHRDIKPGNVLISMNGEIKLTDFGIAFRSNRDEEDDGLTKTGTLLGTPAYMSPEQIHSSKDVDSTTDIYSLGVIFYEMLTGVRPFTNEFTMENVLRIKKGRYQSMRSLNKRIPPRVARVIKKMMHPKKSRRYKNFDKALSALRSVLRFKFHEVKYVPNVFARMISTDFSDDSVTVFKYPRILTILSQTVKTAAIVTVSVLVLVSAWRFFPNEIAQYLLGDYMSLASVSIEDELPMGSGTITLIPENATVLNGKKRILIPDITERKAFKRDLILFPGRYTARLHLHDQVFHSEIVARTYTEKEGASQLDFKIGKPVEDDVAIRYNAFDADNGKRIRGIRLYVRESGTNEFERYLEPSEEEAAATDEDPPLRVVNGKMYDFFIQRRGFNSSYLKDVIIDPWQDRLQLSFMLTPERVKLIFDEPPVPLNIEINGRKSGYVDADGTMRERYGPLQSERVIYIKKGSYNFTFNGKGKVKSSVKKKFSSAREYRVRFSLDESKNLLKVTIK